MFWFASKNKQGVFVENLIVVEFRDAKDGAYNRDYKNKQVAVVKLKHRGNVLECSKQSGQWIRYNQVGGSFRVDLEPGDGRLFKLK